MKILFILHFPPPMHGAAIVGEQIKDSETINKNFSCRYINLGISNNVGEIGKNILGKIKPYFRLLWQVSKYLVKFKPDLCYLTPTAKGVGFYKDFPLILLCKFFRKRLVYHYHNKGVSFRQHKFFDDMLYRLMFRKAEVILISKYLYPDILKYVPKNKVHYCANGIAESLKNKKYGVLIQRVSPTKILFLSNLFKSKGLFVLMAACKILKNRGVNFSCIIVGGAGDVSPKELEERIREAELSENVEYLGSKYGEEKEGVLSQADIFAFPTYNECFGLVLLEAMQHALPVVSTFEGAIPEIVEEGKNGFLVPQRDAEALAEKLELLILNPELRIKMGALGRTKYEKEYTIEKFEDNLTNILEKITTSI